MSLAIRSPARHNAERLLRKYASPARLTLAVAACLTGAVLRLPAIVEPLGIDQGIFAAAAWGMSQGGALYRDLWDQKPPGIHLLYRGAFALIGLDERTVFWLDYAAFLVTILLIVTVGRRLVDASWGWGAAALYALLGLPLVRFRHGGFLERAVPETFIPLCALAAAACLLSPRTATRTGDREDAPWRTRVESLLAGVCLGCAALLKPTGLIYWPMLLAVLPAIAPPLARNWRKVAMWSAIGVAIPIACCVLWLWRLHALDDARVAVFDYNRAYLGEGYSTFAFVNRFVHEVWRWTKNDPLWLLGMSGLALGAIVWIPRAWRRRPSTEGDQDARATDVDRALLLGALWLVAALIAAAANGARFYNTYVMPCLVPLSLLAAGLLFARWRDRTRRVLVLGLLVIVSLRFMSVPQRVAQAVGTDLTQWRSGSDPAARLRYLEGFGNYAAGRGFSARANAELTDWLAAHSVPEDHIFIFGMAPGVYFTSRRLPAQRFLWIAPPASNLLSRPDFSMEAVAADLDRARPRYIIEEYNIRDLLLGWRVEEKFAEPGMQQVLTAYEPALQIEDFAIYGLRSTRLDR